MTTSELPARGVRMSRSARRTQLMGAAREVFVAQGYHAAAMDEIADRAGVSKPVLYQHFPGKLELYLALVDLHCNEVVAEVHAALAATDDNKARVAATIAAYFAYVDREDGASRLVFESDLTNDPGVRERVDGMSRVCAEAIAAVIEEDTGLPPDEAQLLGFALTGMAQTTARFWIERGRRIPRESAEHLVAQLSWRGIRGFPKVEPGVG